MSVEKEQSLKGKEWLSCRDVLWYLSFFGFAINYMLRNNLSLAIVVMVEPRAKAIAVAQCSQLEQLDSANSTQWMNVSSITNITERGIRNEFAETFGPLVALKNNTSRSPTQYSDRFSWDEFEQGLALGGYYWIYWAGQLPGGLLARRYGSKLIFGCANLSTALLGFFLPAAARYHIYVFILLRVLQGFTGSWVWSSMHNMTPKWIPPNEMSKFISSYFGNSIGAALVYPLSSLLVNRFGWPSVFYGTSLLGLIWCIVWYRLAHDTPHEHPRISNAEKTYILESIGNSVNHNGSHLVPWKAILTSVPVWIITFTNFGANWGLHTLNSEAPTYFNHIQGWDIGLAGLLSAAPHVMRMLFAYVSARCADWILRTRKMSKINMRKFAVGISNGCQGLMLLGLAYSGCHSTLAIIFMMLATAANGAGPSGLMANCIDLSPNYSGVILGITNTLTGTAGFISPLIVGYLTENNQTIQQWQLVFMIAVLLMFSTCVLYMLFGSADLQSWNEAGNHGVDEELPELLSDAYTIVPQEDKSKIMEDEKEPPFADDALNIDRIALKYSHM